MSEQSGTPEAPAFKPEDLAVLVSKLPPGGTVTVTRNAEGPGFSISMTGLSMTRREGAGTD